MADDLYYRQRAEILWQSQNYAEAYGSCLILADDYNDPFSQLRVGFCCYFGYGVKKDLSRAVYWYQKAADQGEPISQNNLGGCYECGEGVTKDEKRAVELYTQSANNGYAIGQYNLGRCYEYGVGVVKDVNKAKYWYQKSVEQGFQFAIDGLKRLSSIPSSTTTTQETTTASKTTSKMSKEESYRQKVNTLWESKKYAEAYVTCLILADDYGDTISQRRVAYCYEFGYGVEKSLSRAVYWYQKAADQGDSFAQVSLVSLGICYETGEGVTKNEKRAVELYTQSANNGHVLGQYNLGRCYEYGIGVVKDLNKARDWYQKAVDQGHQKAKDALKKLSSIPSSTTTTQATTTASKTTSKMSKEESYRQKVNTLWESKKYAEAYVTCLILADDYGDAVSQRRVAYCYEFGYGVEKSLSRAVYWYQKAADQGDSIAQNNLGLCYERGEGVAKDEKRAMELYMKSANSGLAVSQYNVGLCYEYGRGVTKDLSKAKYWYQKAADQGHQNAKDALKSLSSAPSSRTTTTTTTTKTTTSAPKPAPFNLMATLKTYSSKYSNVEKGLEHYFSDKLRGALLGDYEDLEMLGRCFFDGAGCEKNEFLGIKCIEMVGDKATKLTFSEDAIIVADGYYYGRGVEKNLDKAFEYYSYNYTKSANTHKSERTPYDFIDDRAYSKSMIDKILAEKPSIAPKSNKPQISIENVYNSIESELSHRFYDRIYRLHYSMGFELDYVVDKYPKYRSYIPTVTFTFKVKFDNDFRCILGRLSTTHRNEFDRQLKEMKLDKLINTLDNGCKVRWINGRMIEIGQLKALRDSYWNEDTSDENSIAWKAFKQAVRDIVAKEWDKRIRENDIIGKQHVVVTKEGFFGKPKMGLKNDYYPIRNYSLSFKKW